MDRTLEFMLELAERRPNLFLKLIWSDEALFNPGGFINRLNSHFWVEQSPYKLLKRSQHRPRLTVWQWPQLTVSSDLWSLETRWMHRDIWRFWKILSFLAFVTLIEIVTSIEIKTWSLCRTRLHSRVHPTRQLFSTSSAINFQGGGLDAEGLSNGLLVHVNSPHVASFFGGGLKCIQYSRCPSTLK